MNKRHYHVIESNYGDPLDEVFYSLRTLRKGIQKAINGYRKDKNWKIKKVSSLWYHITHQKDGDEHEVWFDECTDNDCAGMLWEQQHAQN